MGVNQYRGRYRTRAVHTVRMAYEMMFALVGSRAVLDTDFPDEEAFSTPYADRDKVTLSVNGGDKLGDVYERASREFGVISHGWPYTPTYVSFYSEEHTTVPRGSWTVAVPRADGTAEWREYQEVTVDDLLRSAEAGALNGDPLRPYFIVTPQVGNGALPPWDVVVQMYEVLKQVMDLLGAPGALYASYELLRRLRRRSSESASTMAAHSPRWQRDGADPYTLDEWLDDSPWHAKDLAVLLGCTEGEAEALLWAFGFGQSPSGLWRRREDEEAKLLAGIRMTLISSGYESATVEQLQRLLDQQVREFVESGQAPGSPEWYEIEWLQPNLPGRVAERATNPSLFERMRRKLKGG